MNHQHDKLFQDETHSKAFHFSTRNTRNAVKHVDYQVFHFLHMQIKRSLPAKWNTAQAAAQW